MSQLELFLVYMIRYPLISILTDWYNFAFYSYISHYIPVSEKFTIAYATLPSPTVLLAATPILY